MRHAAVDVVRAADDDGLRQVVDHLVALGHERIAHVDGGRAAGAAERRRGYREALRRHGLTQHERVLPGGLSEEHGVAAARDLLDGPALPTAVTVFNDRCALGVLDTLSRAGLRVPEDVSVAGYDDSRLARLAHVALTSVDQDAPRLARLAVERAAAGGGDGGAAPGDRRAASAGRSVDHGARHALTAGRLGVVRMRKDAGRPAPASRRPGRPRPTRLPRARRRTPRRTSPPGR